MPSDRTTTSPPTRGRVADDELDLGVLAVFGIDMVHRLGAVGDERVMAPVGEQLALGFLGVEVHATDDQPVIAERRLGQLADTAVGVVGHGLPVLLGDLGDPAGDVALHRDADRVVAALLAQASGDLLVPEPRVRAQQDHPGCARAPDAGEQLVDEAQRAALGVGLPLALADVQDLAGAGTGGQQWVVAELLGVAVAGTLLGVAMDLADEAVDVDHQSRLAGAGARLPRSAKRLVEHAIELADMPEGERAQERAERRRGHRPVPQNRLGAPGAQHVAAIDAIRAQQHRVNQREHLAPRPRRARPATQLDRPIDERLDPQPPPHRHRKHDPGVDDHPLVIEYDIRSIRQTVHHVDDLLLQAAVAPNDRFLPAQEVISPPNPDRTTRQNGGSRLRCDS